MIDLKSMVSYIEIMILLLSFTEKMAASGARGIIWLEYYKEKMAILPLLDMILMRRILL
jgi:hypothetical protein